MRVLAFGSSLARDLGDFDQQKSRIIAGVQVDFTYRAFPGTSYEHFLSQPWLIDEVLECQPDYVLTIFGGNSIKRSVEPGVLYDNARAFFNLLKRKLQTVNPAGKIIAHQIPLRFVTNGFYDCPKPKEFAKIRNNLNRKVMNFGSTDYILLIAGRGPDKLDKRSLFKDGIHFKPTGLRLQLARVIAKLEHILVQEAQAQQ